jgi:hypothetical protein
MGEVSPARWEGLRAQRPRTGLVVEAVDPEVEGCLIGIDAEGRIHLLLAVAEEPDELPPDLQGITVRLIEVDRSYLDVSARSHYEAIFTPLANLVFYAWSVQRRRPIDAVSNAIDEFRGALRPVVPELGVGEQIGLFGELWVLVNILLPTIGSRACSLWSGPFRERHDFVGEAAHLEVKTTTASDERHEISRVDQLRAPAGKRLLFASIKLERSMAGDETIASKIDEIGAFLGADGRAIEVFEASLAKLGWHDGLRQTGSLLRFNLRDAQLFEVEGSFPRLPDDYVPPRGISGIKYTIDIAARPTLSKEAALAIVKGM